MAEMAAHSIDPVKVWVNSGVAADGSAAAFVECPFIHSAEVLHIEHRSSDPGQWRIRVAVIVQTNSTQFRSIDDMFCYPCGFGGISFTKPDVALDNNRGFGSLVCLFGVNDFSIDSVEKDRLLERLVEPRAFIARVWSERVALAEVIEVVGFGFSEDQPGSIVVDLKLHDVYGDTLLFRNVLLIADQERRVRFHSLATFDETKRFVRSFGAYNERDPVFVRAITPLLAMIGLPQDRGYLEMFNSESGQYHLMPRGIYFNVAVAKEMMLRLESLGFRGMRVVRGALTKFRQVDFYGKPIQNIGTRDPLE